VDLDALVAAALAEDVGPGDVTTRACVDPRVLGAARVVADEHVVVAGTAVAARVFARLDATWIPHVDDGVAVPAGGRVARVEGPGQALLPGERVALNFLMRLSGIATWTRRHVDAAGGAFAVADTRKTTPLHRVLEKAAVRAGGGVNHRFALHDGVLVKDNHIRAAGGVAEATRRARAGAQAGLAPD